MVRNSSPVWMFQSQIDISLLPTQYIFWSNPIHLRTDNLFHKTQSFILTESSYYEIFWKEYEELVKYINDTSMKYLLGCQPTSWPRGYILAFNSIWRLTPAARSL